MGYFLVTGADGFIGSHLVEHLLVQGHKVRALALYNSFGNAGWLSELGNPKDLEVVLGDIRDFQICEELVHIHILLLIVMFKLM
jgi:nucleoside-diphosphate-sugar epimerase